MSLRSTGKLFSSHARPATSNDLDTRLSAVDKLGLPGRLEAWIYSTPSCHCESTKSQLPLWRTSRGRSAHLCNTRLMLPLWSPTLLCSDLTEHLPVTTVWFPFGGFFSILYWSLLSILYFFGLLPALGLAANASWIADSVERASLPLLIHTKLWSFINSSTAKPFSSVLTLSELGTFKISTLYYIGMFLLPSLQDSRLNKNLLIW